MVPKLPYNNTPIPKEIKKEIATFMDSLLFKAMEEYVDQFFNTFGSNPRSKRLGERIRRKATATVRASKPKQLMGGAGDAIGPYINSLKSIDQEVFKQAKFRVASSSGGATIRVPGSSSSGGSVPSLPSPPGGPGSPGGPPVNPNPGQPGSPGTPPSKNNSPYKLAALIQGFDFLSDALGKLKQLLVNLDPLQKRSLSVNSTLTKVIKENSGLLDKSNAAYYDMVSELISFREEGIKSFTDSTASLVSRMKMTGQDTTGLRKVLSSNQAILMFSSEQQDRFSKTIMDASLKYGRSAESISNSLADMSDKLEILGGTGASENLMAIKTKLSAQFGATGDQTLAKMISYILEPANEKFLQMAGAWQDAMTVQTGDQEEAQQAFKSLTSKMSNLVDRVTNVGGGGLLPSTVRGRMLDTVGGKDVMAFKQGMALFNSIPKELNKAEDALRSLSASWDRMWKSFDEALEPVYQGLVSVFDVIADLVRNISKEQMLWVMRGIIAAATTLSVLASALLGPLGWITGITAVATGSALMAATLADTTKQTNKELKELNRKTKDENSPAYQTEGAIYYKMISSYLSQSIENMPDKGEQERNTKEMVQLLRDLNKKIPSQGASMPSQGVGR